MKSSTVSQPLLSYSRNIFLIIISILSLSDLSAQYEKGRSVKMDIVIIDQPWMYNRLGAMQPTGMIFALKSDVVSIDQNKSIGPGNVQLRDDKRPRPIVLRANVGDQLKITLTNWLTPYNTTDSLERYGQTFSQQKLNVIYPYTRHAGMTIMGMQAVNSTQDLGSLVGNQRPDHSGFVPPGESIIYELLATEQGTFLLYSEGADLDNNNNNGSIGKTVGSTNFNGGGAQISNGLFGSINIQPPGAEYYRSTVTWADLYYATDYWKAQDGTRIPKPSSLPDKVIEGYPVINYATAVYPKGHKYEGKYILRMLDDDNNLLYSDLTAIITGPNTGAFPDDTSDPSFNPVPASPNRNEPFREFSMHYHQAHYLVQAFPDFYGSLKTPTSSGGYDKWGINYGVAGIGPEIYANRIGVGPMADCVDCAYEEFFLSSWSVGDPATPVDIPANTGLFNNKLDVNATLSANLNNAVSSSVQPTIQPDINKFKATKVLYPDDPSNVYFSYMDDHVKFRIHHGSTAGVTHVHHQHAHQWLHSPNSPDGHYLDSQTLNPGASYTLEMVYNGSGNRNKTVGDQIFHCHFYPHFAQGMWGMWRVLDVLEQGTPLDKDGRPVKGSRAYPDAEITKGVPIPAIVPMPTKAMAPTPAQVYLDNDGQVVTPDPTKNPGFPFFIPGKAGSRPPHPPLDFARGPIFNSNGKEISKDGELNGGMPRHLVVDGEVLFENHTKTDWTKIFGKVRAIRLPETGTPVEMAAMKAHAQRQHPTFRPDGQTGNFILNGLPPQSGAPFADPAIDDAGNAVGQKRIYKAANIQMDVVFNKAGWHYPQQRMITLWCDVKPTLSGNRPPEPFFFRANSKTDYIEYWHTNLIPQYYEVDDFQVRTPTDILGQHIHLVKFDVTASDGAANGWNYEDGTFSPDQVRERIHAVSEEGEGVGLFDYQYDPAKPVGLSAGAKLPNPTAQAPNPEWGKAPAGQDWNGAQTTIQRWYADPLMGTDGDRTLRTVFTHDHFGPSTHQQAGLYAGLLVEPEHTKWYDPVTGKQMGTRSDGGPTSWQALVEDTQDPSKSYREFCLEFQDLQLGYLAFSKNNLTPYPDYEDPKYWNGNTFDSAQFKKAADIATNSTNGGWNDQRNALNTPGSQEIISSASRGTYSLNYRNEPLPLRLAAQDETNANINQNFLPSNGPGGDLGLVYRSDIPRGPGGTGQFTKQPKPGSVIAPGSSFKFPKKELTPGMQGGDPFTPLLRAYQGDRVQVRTLVGGQLVDHFFNIQGVNWLFEPSNVNSGYRSTQAMGISEHFEMNFRLGKSGGTKSMPWSDYVYLASSDWSGSINGLWGLMRAYGTQQKSLKALKNNPPPKSLPAQDEFCGCPVDANRVKFDVVAVAVQDLDTSLIYNKSFKIEDPNAMVYLPLEHYRQMKRGERSKATIEPLVLRAHPGDCLEVTLYNLFNRSNTVFNGSISIGGAWQNGVLDTFNYSYTPTMQAGLNVEKLSFNVRTQAGQNVGFNETQTIPPGGNRTYEWWAGRYDDKGNAIPVEFGTCVLSAAEPLAAHTFGLYGAVIIEPTKSYWDPMSSYNSSVKIYKDSLSREILFQEFVMNQQDNLNIGSNYLSYNYKTEPINMIYGGNTKFQLDYNPLDDVDLAFSNAKRGTSSGILSNDPATPVLRVTPGSPVRMRLLQSYGKGNGTIFVLHGHVWQEEPWIEGSTKIGDNWLSQNLGSRGQFGAQNSFELVIPSAGGEHMVEGDFLYRSYIAKQINGGAWGILRVGNPSDEPEYVLNSLKDVGGNIFNISGKVQSPEGMTIDKVRIYSIDSPARSMAGAQVNADGSFNFNNITFPDLYNVYYIRSDKGGEVGFKPGVITDAIQSFQEGIQLESAELAPTRQSLEERRIPGEKPGPGRFIPKKEGRQ